MTETPSCIAYVQPLVTAVFGLTAAIFAYLSIRTTREIARNRATFDFIERTESTEYYQEISRAFHSIKSRADGFGDLYDPQCDATRKLRQQVIQYLNHYENLALAMQFGTLSEEIYYRAFRGAVVADWRAALPFVTHRRTQRVGDRSPNPKAFIEFQWLAERWAGTEAMPGMIKVRRNKLDNSHLRSIPRPRPN